MEALIIGVILIITVSFLSVISQLQNQVRRLQKKADAIAEKLGIEETLPVEVEKEINGLLDQDKRIKAIRVYRQASGDGLKEASEIIDTYIRKRTS